MEKACCGISETDLTMLNWIGLLILCREGVFSPHSVQAGLCEEEPRAVKHKSINTTQRRGGSRQSLISKLHSQGYTFSRVAQAHSLTHT